MLEAVLRFSIERRVFVVVAVLLASAYGAYSLRELPIDAVPDVTNRQVQINTVAPSLSPLEIERQVTFPVETSLAGIPGLVETRSLSRNGFSQVTAVFRDDVDVYFARQQVSERLAAIRASLPGDAVPVLGPITTGLGEVYMWTVEYAHPGGAGANARQGVAGWQPDRSYLTPEGERLTSELERAAYLRTVQDWIIRPQLKGLPGVAEIDAIGGYVKQYEVHPDPRQLAAYDLTFGDLVRALAENNLTTSAGAVEHNGEMYVVRANGRLGALDEIADVPVVERDGTPVRVRDVAAVVPGAAPRLGSASENGEEVVLGAALMLLGGNSRTVAEAVHAKMPEVNRSLPADIRITTVLDRRVLVDATIETVVTNLAEGALLVIAVLFALLGNIRAAFITALAIPLSMLLTAIGMVQTRTSGNLMSLGAIDFGLIVDGAVIVVENCMRRLAQSQSELGRALTRDERLAVVFDATREVRTATAFGEAIIITVYLPILALTGVEGKMFHPMALTVVFALVGAFVLSLTFVPAMVALCIRGRVRERENRAVALARRLYSPVLDFALRRRVAVVSAAVALFGASLLLFRTLGQEFAPTLRELDVLLHAYRLPSTSLTQSTVMQRDLERRLARMPEVAVVFSRTGTADMASDAMPPYLSDTFVMLKPRQDWPNPRETKAEIEGRIASIAASIPGNAYELTQPIQMRFNELIAGVRSDLAVKVFGDDYGEILPVAERVAAILASIPGAADTRLEQITGAPVINIDVDRRSVARYGLSLANVHEVLAIAVAGRKAGEIYQGDRRFDVMVRLPEELRQDPAMLERLAVPLSHRDRMPVSLSLEGDDLARWQARSLPLGALASIDVDEGMNQVSRENGKRRVVAQVNVRGRDLGSFVEEAQGRVADEVRLAPGTWLAWSGQFENLVRAERRLALIVPLCLLLIAALLYASFGALGPAAIVFAGVPLALSGGVASLWLRGMPFSISAAVGFIALSGVAVLNGLVLITFIESLRRGGAPPDEAIRSGALARLRPVLMTALVASLGLAPMAFATGTGAEVQRPLATVVIGGLLSSSALTLVVLPALASLLARQKPGAGRHESEGRT